MESLITIPCETIICNISLWQCSQQQELITDIHPYWKVLSTDGHLPTEKLGAGKQNSQHRAVVHSIMLTYVTGFCFYSKYKRLWHFLIWILTKVWILVVENSFNLAPLGTDRYQIIQHSHYPTIRILKFLQLFFLPLLHLGCRNNPRIIHFYIWFLPFLVGCIFSLTTVMQKDQATVDQGSSQLK
jgi:hypothetical protein